MKLNAWSNLSVETDKVQILDQRYKPISFSSLNTIFGAGRSYSDVALPQPSAQVFLTQSLDRLIEFDDQQGILSAEAGVTLEDILKVIVPRGWILPVMPGTGKATIAGAIANDVHGKNQASEGSFGAHVLSLTLQRSTPYTPVSSMNLVNNGDGDGDLSDSDTSDRSNVTEMISEKENKAIQISPLTHPLLFAATLGGLGATGIITTATLQLKKINSPWLCSLQKRFEQLSDFFILDDQLRAKHEYTVAWLDCLSEKGRGVYFAADHDDNVLNEAKVPPHGLKLMVPFTPPISMVNGLSVKALNETYWHTHSNKEGLLQHYSSFFFPLDGISDWNRLYGPKGFFQYQCLLPYKTAQESLMSILKLCKKHKQGSFLAVLKTFGPQNSPAIMSFAKEGVSFAMDFPYKDEQTLKLLSEFDEIVKQAGGALYPAKDGRMNEELFKTSFPDWEKWWQQRDPALVGSLFLKRVMGSVKETV